MSKNIIKISFCPYNGGDYDLFIEDAVTGEKTCLTGKISDLEKGASEMLCRIAPSCVMNAYEEVSLYG